MRLAIFENIMTPGGHEVDFDRILVEEFKKLGHEVSFYVPEDFEFHYDYRVPVQRLRGKTVSYTNVRGIKKLVYSARREINRQRWYRQLYAGAKDGAFDAVIVPTSTYRYLRAINQNALRHSPVPVIFILHGINPKEAPKFFREVRKLQSCPNVRMVVLTFEDHIFGERFSNVFPMYPPTYTARDISYTPEHTPKELLTIGFFGQYRREKRLRDFLKVFVDGQYSRPVRLLVQGSTMHPEDAEDFERLIAEYRSEKNIEFLHKGLIGAEWQRAIADIDALLMPYSAPRYRYHWGGMLFTAIGFQKPVVASDDINPEVFDAYEIGETFASGDMQALKETLEHFINTFDRKALAYGAGLQRAGEAFSPEAFARRLEAVIRSGFELRRDVEE